MDGSIRQIDVNLNTSARLHTRCHRFYFSLELAWMIVYDCWSFADHNLGIVCDHSRGGGGGVGSPLTHEVVADWNGLVESDSWDAVGLRRDGRFRLPSSTLKAYLWVDLTC